MMLVQQQSLLVLVVEPLTVEAAERPKWVAVAESVAVTEPTVRS